MLIVEDDADMPPEAPPSDESSIPDEPEPGH
jgi:hypothetical protein